MKKRITNSVICANSSTAMETGNHFKNGVSLKNQRSKGNLLVCGILLLLLLGLGNKAMSQVWNIGHPNYNSNVTATLTENTLTINGSGNMCDFWDSTEGEAPWYAVRASIQTVVIQFGVTNIGNRAFHDCNNLHTITIPNTVTIVGRQAFLNCINTNFQTITIPASVIEIEGEAFKNCTNLKTVTIDEGGSINTILNFTRFQYPDHWDAPYYYGWFENCPIQTLNLRKQYAQAGDILFRGNSNLKTLRIGRNVTGIGTYAFADCGALTDVTLEDGSANLVFDGTYNSHSETVFSGCSINNLYIGRNITNGNGSFYGHSSPFYNNTTLETVTVGNNIDIAAYSFQNCYNLETVSIGDKVKSIGDYAFDGCSNLSSVTIGNSVISIGDATFRSCSALTNISIPDKVSTIGGSAFANSGLKSISIPNIVTSIGPYAFADCGALTDVTLEDGSTNDLVFDGTYNSHSETVFSGCSINTLYIGRKITNGYGNFYDHPSPFYNHTALKTLTIGKDLTSIADCAFQGCCYLEQITSNNPTPPTIGANTFNCVIPTIPVHVPCVLAYQSSAWGTIFSNFFQTGDCPSGPTLFTLNVLSSNTDYGHATSISMLSGAVLTSTWNFEGNISTSTSAQFSGKAFLTASARANSVFTGWDDGNLEPMRIVNITDNKTYTAQFSTLGVKEVQNTSSISVYPNPTTGQITIYDEQFTMNGEEYHIYSPIGQLLMQGKLQGETTNVNVASLTKGIYYLKIGAQTVKFVKE